MSHGIGCVGRAALALVLTLCALPVSAGSLVGSLATTNPAHSPSTIPARGDLNPYGVAYVPAGFAAGGTVHAGDLLVSNFNASGNAQGTGTTIVRVTPGGAVSTFYAGPLGLGLTTALGVLSRGFVLVGNVPSLDSSGVCTPGPGGAEQGVGQGSLLIIDRHGHLLRTLESAEFLDGPWDLTLADYGAYAQVFVANVLNGTVARIDLALDGDGESVRVLGMTRIASGYTHRCDPAAFVVGPTGLALDRERNRLYVAATADNAIYAVNDPLRRRGSGGTGALAIADPVHLHGPVGLLVAPDGDLISTQGDAVNPDPAHPSELVEYTPQGRFVAEYSIDPSPGSAFGMALTGSEDEVRFAAVDDGLNVIDIWNLHLDGDQNTQLAERAQLTVRAQAADTIALAASAASVVSGTPVTLTATVSGTSPTGSVTFYDGATALGTQALASGKATLANVMLSVGTHSLTARYAGDANNAQATSAVDTVTVTSCTGYGCGSGMGGGGGGGGGGGYGGGAFDLVTLALLCLPALARRGSRRLGGGGGAVD